METGGMLRLRLLGPVQVERDGAPLRGFESRKALALLCYLALYCEPLTRAHLADLFWPDKPEARGRGNLSRVLHNLSTLMPDCLHADRHTIQFRRSPTCWLDVEAFDQLAAQGDTESLAAAVELYRGDLMAGYYLDDCPDFETWLVVERERWHRRAVEVLENLIEHHTRRAEYQEALNCAHRLLELDPWREEAHRQVMLLLARTGQRSAALTQYQTCCQVLAEELGIEPGLETRTLYERIRDGKFGRGEEEQKSTGEVFSSAPLPLRATVPPAPPAFLSSVSPPVLSQRDAARSTAEEPPSPPAPFVARECELAQLDNFLELALAGQGRVVFVTGDAGSGKTALIREFARRTLKMHGDLIVASGNCNAHTGIGDPYLPFREILGQLSGDVEAQWAAGAISRDHAIRLWNMLPISIRAVLDAGPDLIETFLPSRALIRRAALFSEGADGADWLINLEQVVERKTAVPDDPNLQQGALFEQVTYVLETLARQKPLLLMLDDLQWADAASISLLFHVGRRLAGSRILVVGAYRPVDVALGRPPALAAGQVLTGPGQAERHPLEPVVNEFKRDFGDIEIELGQAGGRGFVDALLDTEANQLGAVFRETLDRQTGGHALFTVELLRGMQERGDLVQDEAGRWVEGPSLDWDRLPARVEAVIAERVGRLPAEWQATLAAASVEGEEFTAEVLARVLGADQKEIIRCLSGPLNRQHRLVAAHRLQQIDPDAQPLSCYRFRHYLYQKYLYQSLDEIERAQLHEATGKALETLYGERASEIAVGLARHFEAAGLRVKAVDYLLQAGDQARGLYAHQEAIRFYQRALILLNEMRAYQRAARTLMKLGLTYHQAFDFPRARDAYEEGFAAWQRAGGAQASSGVPAPHPLRMVWFDPNTLDPAMSEYNVPGMIIGQLFSGLLSLNAELDVVPELAQSWEVLEGGTQYIFHLRDDVLWSDGHPVTAEDLVYAWKRVLNPVIVSPNARYLFDIKGAKAYHQGQLSNPSYVGVRALDEMTLLVELEGSTSYFPQLLTQSPLYPVPRHIVEAHGESWTEMKYLVTNGPFTLARWQRGDCMVLARNPEYRGQFAGNVQEVALALGVDSPAERMAMYEADRLDVVFLSTLPEVSRMQRRYAEEYFSSPHLNTQYICFNMRRPPFDDPRVRRAFVLATDRDTLADVIFGGYLSPATGGFVPSGMPGHSPGIALPYDPEQAHQLLAEAGYLNGGGRDFPVVDLLAYRDLESVCEHLKAQWHENLGVEIRVEIVGSVVFRQRLEEELPHLYIGGWTADYPDPDNFLGVAVIDARRRGGWKKETYIRLLEQARRITHQAERMKLYRKADRMLIEEASIMPILYGRGHWWVKPWVSKYPVSVLNEFFWKDAVIEPH